MFASLLLKSTMPLYSSSRKLMCFAFNQVMYVPKCYVKDLYIGMDSKSIVFQQVNSFSHRLHVKESSSKEENMVAVNEISELLFNLDTYVKKFQRVRYKDAEMLFQYVKKGQIVESNKYSILLLEWCSHAMPDVEISSRISFAHSVWEIFKNCSTGVGTEHYNMLLKCYAANGHRISVLKFLDDMGENVPDNTTYQLLLECTCVVGDLEQAENVLKLMKDKNIPINEATFNSLILGHARAGDIKNSLQTLDAMYAADLLPSANTYTVLLQSYAEYGDIEHIKQIYKEAISKNINLNVSQLLSVCKILAMKKHYTYISEFLALLPNNLKKFTGAFQNMVLELVHSKHVEAALLLVKSVLPEADQKAAEHPCTFLIHAMFGANIEPIDIINICSYMEESGLYLRAMYTAAESALHKADSEMTLQIFHALVKNGAVLRPHYFWPMFRERAKLDGERGVLRTLKDMQELRVKPDFHTIMDYILPAISSYSTETAVQKLKSYGISVRQSLTPIAATILRSGRMQSLLQLCESYPLKMDFEKLLHPLVEAFVKKKNVELIIYFFKTATKHTTDDLAGHFLLELLTIKETRYNNEDIINLLQLFKNESISISSFAADILKQYFKNGGTDPVLFKNSVVLIESITQNGLQISPAETSSYITHPHNMTLEELECHLVELRSKNMNVRGVLRLLLQKHVREGNANRVLELKQELEEGGFKFSPGMLASLFSMYIQLKDVNSAGKILNDIMQLAPDFVLDEHKIINYAALLVSENQYKAAIAVLERRAASGNIVGGENISRNCWQLLNSLALKGEAEKVKHMLHVLKTLGFCSINNILLGPLVRAHIVRGDLHRAVKEYQNCSTEFRKTPLQQELLFYLVGKSSNSPSNQKLLEDVLAATSSVHGDGNTFASLVVVLAECQKKKELRNVIMKYGTKIHYGGLQNRANQLAKDGKLVPLSILAEECEKLTNFDTSLIYTCMLRVFDKLGDYEGALTLWTNMQEKNFQPSSEFLQLLASILRSHNKPVPFDVENTQ